MPAIGSTVRLMSWRFDHFSTLATSFTTLNAARFCSIFPRLSIGLPWHHTFHRLPGNLWENYRVFVRRYTLQRNQRTVAVMASKLLESGDNRTVALET